MALYCTLNFERIYFEEKKLIQFETLNRTFYILSGIIIFWVIVNFFDAAKSSVRRILSSFATGCRLTGWCVYFFTENTGQWVITSDQNIIKSFDFILSYCTTDCVCLISDDLSKVTDYAIKLKLIIFEHGN